MARKSNKNKKPILDLSDTNFVDTESIVLEEAKSVSEYSEESVYDYHVTPGIVNMSAGIISNNKIEEMTDESESIDYNGNANGNYNVNANGNYNGNGNVNYNGNGNVNYNDDYDYNDNANVNYNVNANYNTNSNVNYNGNVNGNYNGNANGNVNANEPVMSRTMILKEKQKLLMRINRLVEYPDISNMTMQNTIEELEDEYERLNEIHKVKNSIKWQKRILLGVTKGAEWANNRWDPIGLKLNGWSNAIAAEMDDYSDIFEEMGEKYKDTFQVSPEIKLIMMVLTSGIMYHLSNQAAEKYAKELPEVSEVLEKDPELKQRFLEVATQEAAAKTIQETLNPMNTFNKLINKQEEPKVNENNFIKPPEISTTINENSESVSLDIDSMSINDLGL